MRTRVAGVIAAAGAIAAFSGAATAQADPASPPSCEHGQFTAAAGAQARDNFIQFVIHDNKAVQCQFDVPPDFHAHS
jgi:hypothetical protein